MQWILVVVALWVAGCSSASKGSRPPAGPDDGVSLEAFELLTKSATDSCSVCARNLRKKAYGILAQRFPPGAVVATGSNRVFLRVPAAENELALVTEAGPDPPLTFRFHTSDDHLVGISAADFTDSLLAERWRAAPPGAAFQGTIEIVAFAYGDGPTFLYHPAEHRVEVHCRILELTGD